MFSPILQRGDDIAFPARARFQVGSTCLATYNGALWPVVLCGEDGIPSSFKDQPHQPHEIPVILLGRHKYMWLSGDRLQEFDPNHDYLKDMAPFDQPDIVKEDDDPTRVEKQRRTAFRQDAMEFKDPDYWHNFIQKKSEARKLEAEMHAKDMQRQSKETPKRKRSGDSSSSGSSKKKKPHYKDFKQLLTPKSSSKKSKNRFGKEYAHLFETQGDDEGFDETFENGDNDDSLLFVPETKDSDDVFEPKRSSRKWNYARGYSQVSAPLTPPEMGPDMCRIFIGPNSTGIIVPLISLDPCSYLLERQSMDNGKIIIDLRGDPTALSLNLTEREFMKIYEYFHTTDLRPLDTHIPHLTSQQKSGYAEQLGLAFVAASKIQHELLEESIKEKLVAMYPLPPFTILALAKIISSMRITKEGARAEKSVKDYVTDYVAMEFWGLARHQSDALQSLLKDHPDLRVRVFEKVSERLEMGDVRDGY